jgi:hypothetical protein
MKIFPMGLLVLRQKNHVKKSDVEPEGGTIAPLQRGKIGGKWQIHPPVPLLPQRNAVLLDRDL